MNSNMVSVVVEINNIGDRDFNSDGFIVARLDLSNGKPELWFYGFYEEEDFANSVAISLRNGVVLRVSGGEKS